MGAENSKPVVRENLQEVEYNEKVMDRFATLSVQDLQSSSADITVSSLEKFGKLFQEDSKNLLSKNALVNNDPTSVFLNSAAVTRHDRHLFNVKLDLEGSATNQKSSGRCWLFAGTNIMRLAVISKYKLPDDFELSQSYLFFYDKLEKANWFLENMIDLAHKDIDDRVVQYLLT
ncbi:peptidase C1-like family-domain-containing protein, partial [Sporodiniella umbellata]